MSEKTVVVALGHKALGATLPEQKQATKAAAKAIADLVEDGAHVVISHSNGPVSYTHLIATVAVCRKIFITLLIFRK